MRWEKNLSENFRNRVYAFRCSRKKISFISYRDYGRTSRKIRYGSDQNKHIIFGDSSSFFSRIGSEIKKKKNLSRKKIKSCNRSDCSRKFCPHPETSAVSIPRVALFNGPLNKLHHPLAANQGTLFSRFAKKKK